MKCLLLISLLLLARPACCLADLYDSYLFADFPENNSLLMEPWLAEALPVIRNPLVKPDDKAAEQELSEEERKELAERLRDIDRKLDEILLKDNETEATKTDKLAGGDELDALEPEAFIELGVDTSNPTAILDDLDAVETDTEEAEETGTEGLGIEEEDSSIAGAGTE